MKTMFSKILFFLSLLFFYFNLFSTTQNVSCQTDKECGIARKCYNNVCMKKKEFFSSYSVVEVSLGKNDPTLLGGLIVASPAKNLVLAQFKITTEDNSGKFYSFDAISFKIKKCSPDVIFSNIKLIYDKNKNGKFDSSESIIAEQKIIDTNSVKLETDISKSIYKSGEEENFLIVADVDFAKSEIPSTALFGVVVSNKADIFISNGGTVDFKPVTLAFATFNFEPSKDYFIVEKMKTLKAPVSWQEINKPQKMLLIRVKAIDEDNSINSLTIKTSDGSAKFGEEFSDISLYFSDNNLYESKLIAKKVFSKDESFNAVVLSTNLSLKKGEEKYLLIKGTLFMYSGSHAQKDINENSFNRQKNKSFLKLPIESEKFEYKCNKSNKDCRVKEEDSSNSEGGCSLLLF